MSDENEASVLFNLKELMNPEEERIESEDEVERQRMDDEERQRKEGEERLRAEEEARRQAEEDVVAAAAQAKRDEEERILQDREGAALRVKLDAEAAERAETNTKQLAHDMKLKELESKRRKGTHPAVLAAIVLLALGGGGYGWFGFYVPAQEAAAAEVREAEMKIAEAAKASQVAADEAAKARETAEAALADAMKRADSAEIAAAKVKLAQANSAVAKAPRKARRKVKRPSAGDGKTAAKKPQSSGDDPLAGLDF